MFNNIITTKQSIINAISAHPKLLALGIGLAITMAIGTALGAVYHPQVVFAPTGSCSACVRNAG